MNKIFLSHSSKDKEFVRPIADYFGNDRCVFDEMTFRPGMKTIQEIFSNIDNTDIFVYFVSDESLNSEWVKEEINKAEEKLNDNSYRISQIFPIIIDDEVDHTDRRIPDFLKKGFSSYNLRPIRNEKIACKKIDSQLINLQMNKDMSFMKNMNLFYGRDIEKKSFKDKFDERDENGIIKHIKCLIVSGIDGIGRKSYIRGVLKDAELMERYYFPMSLSLNQSETIDDLIVKISELGLGKYSIEEIIQITEMEQKIDLLAELLIEAQKYHEHIIIDDNQCLVRMDNDIVYWFMHALKKIKNQIVVSIITRIQIDYFKRKNYSNIFFISLTELSKPDTAGLLRAYSKQENIPFETEDIDFFQYILSGYPPQVKKCVELAKAHNSIEYIKNNSEMISSIPNKISTKILDIIVEPELTSEYYGFLAFLAEFGTTPLKLISEVTKINPNYHKVFSRLKSFTICNYMGASNEYVKINAVIQDYILRNYGLSEDIKGYLNKNIEEFMGNIEDARYTSYLDFSEFGYYLKENLKKTIKIPQKLLYSTVFLRTVMELYNKQDYPKVSLIVRNIKQNGMFELYDYEVKKNLQFYFCRSLARERSVEFEAEVNFFKENDDFISYNFLKGFNYRLSGNYNLAESSYRKVLSRNSNHRKVKRELVLIYTNLQDFDTALDLAEQNYSSDPENIFQIQTYFDCLIRRTEINSKQEKDIADMLSTISRIHRNKPCDIYYQVRAKYEAFNKNNKNDAIDYLNQGIKNFSDSIYLLRDLFDVYRKFEDVGGMAEAIKMLESAIKGNYRSFEAALVSRKVILDAFQGKSKIAIEIMVNKYSVLTENAKKNLLNKVDDILSKRKMK